MSRATGSSKHLEEEQAYATGHSMAAMQTALHAPPCSSTPDSAAHLMSCMAAAMAAGGATSALVNTTATGTSRARATARCSWVTLVIPVMGQMHSSTWSGSCRAQQEGCSQGCCWPLKGVGPAATRYLAAASPCRPGAPGRVAVWGWHMSDR